MIVKTKIIISISLSNDLQFVGECVLHVHLIIRKNFKYFLLATEFPQSVTYESGSFKSK